MKCEVKQSKTKQCSAKSPLAVAIRTKTLLGSRWDNLTSPKYADLILSVEIGGWGGGMVPGWVTFTQKEYEPILEPQTKKVHNKHKHTQQIQTKSTTQKALSSLQQGVWKGGGWVVPGASTHPEVKLAF